MAKMKAPQSTLVNSAPQIPKKNARFFRVVPVALFLLGVTVVYYRPIITARGTIWNDFIEQYYPYRAFATESLRNLTFPFWNPYTFSGMPFFADLQTAVLYPLNLALTLVSGSNLSPALFQIQIVFHVFLAGLFMYLLARSWNMSRGGSLVSALSFMFCGFVTGHIFHVTMIQALPWIVLAVLTISRTLKRQSILYAAVSGIVLSFISFAGHPQLLLYTYYWLGSYLIFHCVMIVRSSHRALRNILIAIGLFISAVALGFGISAVQILPANTLANHSARSEMAFEDATEGSIRPYRLITLVAPNFFGTPNRFASKTTPYWGIGKNDVNPGVHYYWETAIYVGIIPLILALCAAIFLKSTALVVFLSAMSALALLLSMGDTAGLFRLFHELLPGFDRFRIPGRFSLFFALPTALLAGIGLDWLRTFALRGSPKVKKRFFTTLFVMTGLSLLVSILFSAGAFNRSIVHFLLESGRFGTDAQMLERFVSQQVLASSGKTLWILTLLTASFATIMYLYVSNRLSSRKTIIVLVIVTFVDLLLFGYGYAAVKIKPADIYRTTGLIKAILDEGERETFRINSRGSAPGSDEIGGSQMLFKRNAGTVHRMFLMEGYNPLRLEKQLLKRTDRVLDILNVKYKISTDNKGQIGIERHPSYLPRAWMTFSSRIIPDDDDILPALHSSDFDHRNSVILEEKPAIALPGSEPDNHTTRITSYSINRIEIEVETDRNGLLVLSEIHYPAWKAFIDKKQIPIYRANYALRAIPVPAGKHTVVCEYKDSAFSKGLVLSVVSLLIALGTIMASRFFRRSQGVPDSTKES